MPIKTHIPAAELGARAELLLAKTILPSLSLADRTKLVLIDVDSGAYEIGLYDLDLEERLLAKYPDASMVLLRADGGPTGQIGWPLVAAS